MYRQKVKGKDSVNSVRHLAKSDEMSHEKEDCSESHCVWESSPAWQPQKVLGEGLINKVLVRGGRRRLRHKRIDLHLT